MEEITQETWQVRAVAAEFMAFSFRYPTPELVEAVISGEWADAAQEIAGVLGLPLAPEFETYAAEAKRLGAEEGADTYIHTLRAEATHLFIGAPKPVCSPFEGVWRAEDDGVQPLLFVNPHSMDVERFCKKCGLGRPAGTNEPLDHVATEMELLQYLGMIASGLGTIPEGGPKEETFPGGSAAAAYQEFVPEHILTWVPRFADKVVEESRVDFYKAAALFMKAWCETLA